MYRVAICDDEPRDRAIIRGFTQQVLAEEGQRYEIAEYGAPEELFLALQREPACCDLILLDVMFPGPGESGLAFARRLRETRLGVSIILVSSSPEYVLDGYGVQAVQYLLKPLEIGRFRSALLYDLHNRFSARALTLSCSRGKVSVRQESILYLESRGHITYVHLADGQVISVAQKLSALQARLASACFCSCHKSFCVNLNYAARLERYQLTLLGGQILPVSKKRFSLFRQIFIKFPSSLP